MAQGFVAFAALTRGALRHELQSQIVAGETRRADFGDCGGVNHLAVGQCVVEVVFAVKFGELAGVFGPKRHIVPFDTAVSSRFRVTNERASALPAGPCELPGVFEKLRGVCNAIASFELVWFRHVIFPFVGLIRRRSTSRRCGHGVIFARAKRSNRWRFQNTGIRQTRAQ
jgi:hypothetical protein